MMSSAFPRGGGPAAVKMNQRQISWLSLLDAVATGWGITGAANVLRRGLGACFLRLQCDLVLLCFLVEKSAEERRSCKHIEI